MGYIGVHGVNGRAIARDTGGAAAGIVTGAAGFVLVLGLIAWLCVWVLVALGVAGLVVLAWRVGRRIDARRQGATDARYRTDLAAWHREQAAIHRARADAERARCIALLNR